MSIPIGTAIRTGLRLVRWGNKLGPWASGTSTLDTSRPTVTPNGQTTPITEYFEQRPWRRTVFVLNRQTGQEATYDFDHDSRPEYAPFLWFGTHSGNRYPPVVGGDGVITSLMTFNPAQPSLGVILPAGR